MDVVPVDTPYTTPLDAPIVATPGRLDVQAPPPTALESVMVVPTHSADGPEMADGDGPTDNMIVLLQPLPSV